MSITTKDTSCRIGHITISDDVLRESINTGLAARIFHGSVPLDVKRNWMHSDSTFLIWHPQFDELEQGEIIPDYSALITNGVITWERLPDRAEIKPIGAEAVALNKTGGAA